MSFELPPLPYSHDALEPHISRQTLEFHHGKHHNTYVTTLNGLIEGTPLADQPLESIIKEAFGKDDLRTVFNNAAQVWNHDFYWKCMRAGGGGRPSGGLLRRLEEDLGGYDGFRARMEEAAVKQFGSGWAWLVDDAGRLSVMSTANAENPMCFGKKALLTIDVWEHAYYLDYQNRRPAHVKAFLDNLVDWDYVERMLET